MAAERLRTPEVEALLEALLALDDPDEMYAFLQDVVHHPGDPGHGAAARRRAHARAGEHYSDIQEATGASATTICRVSQSLNYGADGYRARARAARRRAPRKRAE